MKQDILSPDFLDHFHEKVHEPIRATPVNLPTINKVSRGPGGGHWNPGIRLCQWKSCEW